MGPFSFRFPFSFSTNVSFGISARLKKGYPRVLLGPGGNCWNTPFRMGAYYNMALY